MVDEPIIITGGSVELEVSDKFKENGGGNGKKKYKLDGKKLVSLKVNGTEVAKLSQADRITVECDDA